MSLWMWVSRVYQAFRLGGINGKQMFIDGLLVLEEPCKIATIVGREPEGMGYRVIY